METLFYLILAAVIYGVLSDHADRVVDREMRARRSGVDLHLVEDFDVRPALPAGHGWIFRRHARLRKGVREIGAQQRAPGS